MKRYWLLGLFVALIVGTATWMTLRESQAPRVSAFPDEPYDIRREMAFEGTVVRIDPNRFGATKGGEGYGCH